jgi:purine-binding chemotaxis protein CheW
MTENQYVIFTLCNESYGIEISAVDSIIEMQSITVVPLAPDYVEGVINLRGVVLPVINLCRRFRLPEQAPTAKTRITNVKMDLLVVGVIVDAVSEVIRIPEDVIEPLSPVITTVDSVFIAGIAKLPERLIILLNMEQVFNHQEKTDLRRIETDTKP